MFTVSNDQKVEDKTTRTYTFPVTSNEKLQAQEEQMVRHRLQDNTRLEFPDI